MSWECPVFAPPGLVAGEDLTAKQYHFVKISGDNEVEVCDGATDKPIGILQNAPDDGEEAEVLSIGVSKVVPDENLTAGMLVGTSGDGQGADVTAGSDETVYICGQVIEGGDAGEMATVIINAINIARAQ